jgi:hypothetical protein
MRKSYMLADYHQACEKVVSRPPDLTDADLEVLEAFGDSRAAAVKAARQKALSPPAADPGTSPTTDGTDSAEAFTHWDVTKALVEFVDAINEKNKARNARLAALEAQVQILETRALNATADRTAIKEQLDTLKAEVPHDAGVWRAGATYVKGAIVTHRGSGWICKSSHVAIGTDLDHTAFRLLVKSGRDGKDAR